MRVRTVRRTGDGPVAKLRSAAAGLAGLGREGGIVHLMWPTLPAMDALRLATLRVPTVLTVHNHVPHRRDRLRELGLARLYRSADRLVFASEYTAARFVETFGGAFGAPRAVVPHGLLEPAGGGAPGAWPRTLEPSVVFAGLVRRYKGVETLIEAAPALAADGLGVEIHGRWDAGLERDRAFVAREGGAFRRVDRFLDDEEFAALMRRDALFVMPYRAATQSGVLYTLLGARRAFVASRAGDTARTLEAAGLGELLFEPGDARSLVEAVRRARAGLGALTERLEALRESRRWERLLDAAAVERIYGPD